MRDRRRFLMGAAALLQTQGGVSREGLERSRGYAPGAPSVRLERLWLGDLCRMRVVNTGKESVAVKEVVLFDLKHDLPGETALYGESFQMLSQTAGTLAAPVDLAYSELKHYRIPQPEDARVVTGMMTLSPSEGDHRLMAFTSCRRFSGRFYLRPGSIQVVADTEGLTLGPGEAWTLEEFLFVAGSSRPALLERLAREINRNHPPLRFAKPPTGWCSWYCFGPSVTAQQVLDNLDTISKQIPGLKYVQIDDGYQPAMGDWLETGGAFGGDIRGVLKEIKKRGFEPAIWVGPFIAEAGSRVFREHPEWFVQDAAGKPLSSERVTFAGWRRKPWYALDGTHPGAQRHLEDVFRTMRQEWGCTYFKLDANFWGAMHGGHFHDAKATRIEAYRRGMEAVRRGAGDSFLLGCNHPVWGSFGLIHGSRSSGDVSRKWSVMKTIARETLNRNWQNGRLWWNDPDCVLLKGNVTPDELQFHATAVLASGGMVLAGDDLTQIPMNVMNVLKKFLPPTGVAAEFEDASLEAGVIPAAGEPIVCAFNWSDELKTIRVPLPRAGVLVDFWSGANLGRHERVFEVRGMAPHSARLLKLVRS